MNRWIVAASIAFPAVAGAQGVRGTVVDQATRQPIAGAVVFLLDAANGVVARDLTDEAGAYRLAAPRAGSYRTRTLRIGFRPVLSNPVTVGDGPDVTLELSIESVPVSLAAVRVERQANCPARQDASRAYNAWNEVATALNAALLSSRMRGTTTTIVAYDRWTAPGSDVILRQGANVRSGLPGQPWRSVSADSLHRAGFVVREPNGWYVFHALDLDVLLSDTFLQDHCLQLRGVDKGEIALEFTPSRDRSRIAEIRGFVWLDASTLELKRLQFRYVNVLRQYAQADAGGDLEFQKLRNGAWIVSRWQIRMPTEFRQERSDSYGNLRGDPGIRATEVKTTGGDVLRVVHNGDTVWSVPRRTLEGRVVDSASRRPLPGAFVRIAGTGYAAAADAQGRFRIDDMIPGAYTLLVHTPELDSLAAPHQASVLFANEPREVEVRVASAASIVSQWCPAIRRNQRSASNAPLGMLMGVITAHDSTPVSGAQVTLEWNDFTVDAAGVSQRPRNLTATTDSHGVYRACGVPTYQPLLLSTEFDGAAFPTPVRVESESRTRRFDIRLDRDRRRITQPR